jgi:hypothetical protein
MVFFFCRSVSFMPTCSTVSVQVPVTGFDFASAEPVQRAVMANTTAKIVNLFMSCSSCVSGIEHWLDRDADYLRDPKGDYSDGKLLAGARSR